MNTKLSNTIMGCLGLTSTLSLAGPMEEVAITPPPRGPSFTSDLLGFSLSARARYEFREVDGLDASHATTLRLRPGITLFPKKDLSFFIESENTIAITEDYQVGTPQSANFTPFTAGNTPIGDPETNELNQFYVKYKFNEMATITAGRQRYILDKAAFVGNVGWRQNEQTIDAISVKGKYNGLTYSYAVGDRVNRIFGSDASGGVQNLVGTFHLLHGSYALNPSTTIGSYVYLMDFDEQGGFASNNTYGAFADLKTSSGNYHAEFAYQTEAGSKADYDAVYGHVNWGKKFGSVDVSAGVEYLGEQFITPLGTVHAFNGFADAFIAQRLGLSPAWNGLTDFYVGAGTKIDDVVVKGRVHAFFDESLSDQYGWEIDVVAIKPISENVKLLAKAAYFIGDNDAQFASFQNDIKQFSVQLDFAF